MNDNPKEVQNNADKQRELHKYSGTSDWKRGRDHIASSEADEFASMENISSLGYQPTGEIERSLETWERDHNDLQQSSVSDGIGERGIRTKHSEAYERVRETSVGRDQHGSVTNFTLSAEYGIGIGGAKAKFKDNIAAIQLVKSLEKAGKIPTHEERIVLSRYVGWGGLDKAFDSLNEAWVNEFNLLKDLLSDSEYEEARSSTLNAHYTPLDVIDGVYEGLKKLGVSDGVKILEPASGIGHFAGRIPLKPADMVMVELDPISSSISKYLYPEYQTFNGGFEQFSLLNNYFDVSIGNPPFGDYRIHDHNYPQLSRFSIHNYFIGKSIEAVRPGGITAMIVSRYFMDAKDSEARENIAKSARFIGAIRLPSNTFKENALTSVTTDIVFFQKMKQGEEHTLSWTDTLSVELAGSDVKQQINCYFVENPDQVIGELKSVSGPYGPVVECIAGPELGDIKTEIIKRLDALPHNVFVNENFVIQEQDEDKPDVDFTDTVIKPDSFFITPNDRLAVRLEDIMGRQAYDYVNAANDTVEKRIRSAIDIRNSLYNLISLETSDANEITIKQERGALNNLYDKHVKKYGYLSSQVSRSALRNDPAYTLLTSLEIDYDKGLTKSAAEKEKREPREPSAQKADILIRRVNSPRTVISNTQDSKEALIICLNENGYVDMPFLEKITGKNEVDISTELRSLIYRNPQNREWETATKYLSGNVKSKLEMARNAGDEYQKNVQDLEKALPPDVDAIDIVVQMNSAWIPSDVIKDFITKELKLGGIYGECYVDYQTSIGQWVCRVTGGRQHDLKVKWGTERLDATDIVERIMQNHEVKVTNFVSVNEKGVRTYKVDLDATLEAQGKAEEIKNAFNDWVWADESRRNRLSQIYNEKMNTHAVASYDGSHLILPAIANGIVLKPHQKNAIWRGIQEGGGLLDHTVGAGKTFEAIAIMMESRRMGLLKKPMAVVPNNVLGQWKDEVYRLYPTAKILVADKTDFEKDNRRKLFSKIATGDWDAVIVAHSSFQFIGVSEKNQKAFFDEQLADIDAELIVAKDKDRKSLSVKNLEKSKKRLKEKIDKASNTGRKDDHLTFEQLGVDALFVDEADLFKNLPVITSYSNIAGLGNVSGSQKCTDLFIKVRTLQKARGGKGLYSLTGTPISNTIAEVYTMQRYHQYDTLKEKNLLSFDAWASAFAQVSTNWELDATGVNYKAVARFAKFNNVPELMRLYRSFSDVITQKDLAIQAEKDGSGRFVPKVTGGKPKNIICPRSPQQAEYMGIEEKVIGFDGIPLRDSLGNFITKWTTGSIIDRMINKEPNPRIDNALKITNDARLAALDFRLIDPSAPDFDKSKINVAVENIFEVYKKNDYRKGTQLVFCDLSTPKKQSGATLTDKNIIIDIPEEDSDVSDNGISMDELFNRTKESSFSVYEDLYQKLVDKGMQPHEIRFIHDAKNEAQRKALYRDVNNGTIRVLIGSTSKMGAGTNVQRRLVAQHHLECPWRPRDIEQRDGRIIRQGNMFFEQDREGFSVDIFRYATERTYDARMWQTVEVKARAIEQFRNGSIEDRTIDDVSGEAASAAEIKAAATGNHLIFQQVKIEAEKKKEETKFRSWQRSKHVQENRIQQLPRLIEKASLNHIKYQSQREYLQNNARKLALTTDEMEFKWKGEDGKINNDVSEKVLRYFTHHVVRRIESYKDDMALGKYRGVEINVGSYFNADFAKYPKFYFTIDGHKVLGGSGSSEIIYGPSDSLNVKGFFTRVDNILNRLSYEIKNEKDSRLDYYKEEKRQLEIELEELSLSISGEYPNVDYLNSLRKDSVDVMSELKRMQSDSDYRSQWKPSSELLDNKLGIETSDSVENNDMKEIKKNRDLVIDESISNSIQRILPELDEVSLVVKSEDSEKLSSLIKEKIESNIEKEAALTKNSNNIQKAPEMLTEPSTVDSSAIAEEFGAVLEKNGFILDEVPILDGKKHRVQTVDDKPEQFTGTYSSHSDNMVSGWFQDSKKHEKVQQWVSNTISPEANILANIKEISEHNVKEKRILSETKQQYRAEITKENYDAMDIAIEHPHLSEKKITAFSGVKINSSGELYIPLCNINGEIVSAQLIDEKGKKTLKNEPQKSGSFFIVGAELDGLADINEICFAEEYESAASIYLSTGKPTIMCVDSDNLLIVAEKFKEKHPDKKFIIFANDDRGKKINISINKASLAAEMTNGVMIAPLFTDREKYDLKLVNFNDWCCSIGNAEVKKYIDSQLDGLMVNWSMSDSLSKSNASYPLSELQPIPECIVVSELLEQYFLGEINGKEVLAAAQLAANNSADAKFMLATCYADGVGTEANDQLAIEYYLDASNSGSAESSYRLAEIYEHGLHGVKKDYLAALDFYKKSSSSADFKKMAFAAMNRVEKITNSPSFKLGELEHDKELVISQLKEVITSSELWQKNSMLLPRSNVSISSGESVHCVSATLQTHIKQCMLEARKEREQSELDCSSKQIGVYRGITLFVLSQAGKVQIGLSTPMTGMHEPKSLMYQKGVRETFNLTELIDSVDNYIKENDLMSMQTKLLDKSKNELKDKLDHLNLQIKDMNAPNENLNVKQKNKQVN
ncbi:helicase-related protein [Xenorhabdus nematophila]|uniref:Eco57I restriction-modification methylase domain-containing protein n=1 Tax=Xenorhabdus nematophila TaxID=628 RepID=UPI0032B8047F